ncbi:hypothetical protein EC990672_4985A, partial [Escherichia coli 99.0672]
MLCRLTNKDC